MGTVAIYLGIFIIFFGEMIMGKPFESPKIAMDTKELVIYPLSVEWVRYKIILAMYEVAFFIYVNLTRVRT